MLPFFIDVPFKSNQAQGLWNERELAFFTDVRLTKFWGKVSNYLMDVQADYRDSAACSLIGDVLNPLNFGFDKTGTSEQPPRKTKIRNAQKKADPVINRIVKLSDELANALEELEGITSNYPCETRLVSVLHQLFDETALGNFRNDYGVRTYTALRILAQKFHEYPKTKELFRKVPYMASQKSTWVDWMHQAESNLALTVRMYPGSLPLSESDWVNLAKVLIGGHVSRVAVQAARRLRGVKSE